ncbi:MAG: hypothetical protein C0596_09745 [Marinilabiliales bacterium]|nr:MAG: hypothetical protein C0596_09745 [Marinilabiliales bacterium]
MKTIISLSIALLSFMGLSAQCVTGFNQTFVETTGVFEAYFINGQDTLFTDDGVDFIWTVNEATLTGDVITVEFLEDVYYTICLTGSGLGCTSTYCDSVYFSSDPITDSCNLFLSYDITHASSVNINDGAIDITVQGGTAPFAYDWSNGEYTEDISGLYHGDYTVIVTDNIGCSMAYSFYVASLDSTYSDSTVVDYFYSNISYYFETEDDCTASLTAEAFGGTPPYAYEWMNASPSQTNLQTITGACGGDVYCVVVTDSEGLVSESCITVDYYYQDSSWVVNDTLETIIDTCLDVVYGEIVEYVIDGDLIIVTWVFVDNEDETTYITITYPAEDSIAEGVYELTLYVNCDDFKSITAYSDWIQVSEDDLTEIEQIIQQTDFDVYPNPLESTLYLDIYTENPEHAVIQIFNSAGQIIQSIDKSLYYGQNNFSFNVGELPQGIYFVRILGENSYKTKRIIK